MALLKKHFLLLVLTPFVLVSCNNDDDGAFPNNVGIKGKILTQNEFAQPIYEERDGINVFYETGFRDFTVQGDVVGNYQLGGAPVGQYTITYSKPGFGTIINRNISISTVNPAYPIDNGFQKLPQVTLTKLPNTSFQTLSLELDATVNGSDTTYELHLTTTMIPAPPPNGLEKGFRVFIGDSPLVSVEDFIFQKHYTTDEAIIELTIGNELFSELDPESGDEIYVIVYGDASFDLVDTRPDESLRFPNITAEASPAASVTLP